MGNCRSTTVEQDVIERQEGDRTPLGHHIFALTKGSRSRALWCVKIAEEEVGRPIYFVDFQRVWKRETWRAKVMPLVCLLQLATELVVNDEILVNFKFTQFSANSKWQRTPDNETGFELYSDRVRRIFWEYSLDAGLRFQPKEETQMINFNAFKELMCSKDLSRIREFEWIDH